MLLKKVAEYDTTELSALKVISTQLDYSSLFDGKETEMKVIDLQVGV